MKMQSLVMPAWMAGIHQVRRMRPETSVSPWIPALHAGMTQSRDLLELTGTYPASYFSNGSRINFESFMVNGSLEFQTEELLSVIQHDLLAHFRFHVHLLEFFQPALDADGRPVGAEHRFILK
jgi:hypothetical protein